MTLPFLRKTSEKPANQIVPKTSKKLTQQASTVNQFVENRANADTGIDLIYYGACYMW